MQGILFYKIISHSVWKQHLCDNKSTVDCMDSIVLWLETWSFTLEGI